MSPFFMKTHNFGKYTLVAVVFGLLLAWYYFTDFDVTKHQFLTAALKVPSIRNYGGESPMQTVNFFNKFGWAITLGFALVSWLVSLILLLILKIVRLAKFRISNLIILLLTYGAVLGLAIELLFYEKRYAVATIGTIFFVGQPLYSAAVGTLIFIALIFVVPIIVGLFKKKKTPPTSPSSGEKTEKIVLEPVLDVKPEAEKPNIISTASKLLVIGALLLTSEGCTLFSGTESLACKLAPDSAHCYQDEAVSSGDPDICDKIIQPAKFKDMGSNPPKDKCYLMVAQNTGNLDVCEKIKGGMLSYTIDQCVLEASIENQNASGCQKLSGASKTQCVSTLGPLMTADKVMEVDSQIEILQNELKKGSDANLEKQLAGLEAKKKDMMAIMTKDNKDNYSFQSDPVNKQIVGEWSTGSVDSATKDKIINVNAQLKAQGLTMTPEQYTAIKEYYKYKNNPENDIEKMDDAQIVKDRLGEKVGNLVDKLKFWNSKDTPQEKAEDQQLRFYQRMLERQEAITKGLSVKEMNYENTVEAIGEKVKEKVADEAKDKIIEHVFGEATGLTTKVTTAVLGEAINTVKKEAQSAEFRGLVKAYDDGMAEELGKFGGNVDKAHAEVVKKLSADPYTYASGDSFAKYGNLIENKDCDGTNPHCIQKDVFWKAMKKSYKYQNQGA